MGFGNISIWQLLILLLIVVLVFGTKKLRTLGNDLGTAIRDFRKGVKEEESEPDSSDQDQAVESRQAADDKPGDTSTPGT